MKNNRYFKKDFNFIKTALIFLFVLLFTQLLQAQNKSYIRKISQKFTNKVANEYVGKVLELNNTTTNNFVTISAFCLNNSLQTTFYYRIYTNDTWQSWRELTEDKETKNTKRKVYGLLTIFQKFDKIQFKSSEKVTDQVNFRLFYAIDNQESTPNNYKENTNVLNCDLPSFCDRDCWCTSGDCTPQSSPSYTEVTHVIVHHSGTNYASDTDYKQVVYSYWDYHVNTHGWNDIGYNWLVDPNGVLYQGRGDAVQGAHFSCMNGNTMGVCVIGDFQTATPTTETLATLEDLIAWEATDKGIDVLTSSYHPPSQLDLQHISGHRDGNVSSVGCPSGTVCPGNHLYYELPAIRSDIASFSCYVADIGDEISNPIKLYPNPINDILSIENETNISIDQILIYNALGLKIRLINQPKNKIDFSEMKSGVYLVKLIHKTKSNTFTVYKK